ncbi:MAG TPA: hypothetical protein PL141_08730 [Thermoflexales bacterium]|nr:hypothetical protein [Thermoflexales bacterium]
MPLAVAPRAALCHIKAFLRRSLCGACLLKKDFLSAAKHLEIVFQSKSDSDFCWNYFVRGVHASASTASAQRQADKIRRLSIGKPAGAGYKICANPQAGFPTE